MDNFCPPSSQFAVYNKIAAPKDMVIYPDFHHERLPEGEDRSLLSMLGMQFINKSSSNKNLLLELLLHDF